ncbi:beta-glucosidase [Nocardia barduliensis]|uniref:beta-glucosidase n=1 Tax=Nocardia barduliensis TaxID=2736643 RepID=UPI001573285C|nr:glycoside hydrolase family 3 C-terminal domain-containing protein [Nocardia barduliensis]
MTDPSRAWGTAFADAVDAVRRGEQDVDQAVDGVIGQMTEAELLWLLDGDIPIYRGVRGLMKRFRSVPTEAGRIDRLGIPGIRFTDGPRGVVMQHSTCFPVPISRAATFDVALERTIGGAIGMEASALGANLFGGICVNLAPAPGWGRSQESYGEDPVLLGAMGAALTEGVNPWVMTTVKHFALNSMEEARFTVDVRVEEDVLREVYLPHFRTVVEAGVDAVMTAYNAVNGEFAGENRHLVTDVLRKDWGFAGFALTDWIWGLRNPVESVLAGQDLEMPFRQQRAAALPGALRDGRLTRADIERPATRLLRAQLRFAVRARPTPTPDVVASPAHRELAREAARRGTVLLRNQPVGGTPLLPLDQASLGRIAVLGRLCDRPNLGDNGSSMVTPPSTSSVVDGLRERLGRRVVTVDSTDTTVAAAAARAADVAVVVVGNTAIDEGESLAAFDVNTMRLTGGPLRFRPVATLAAKAMGYMLARKEAAGGDRRDLHLRPDDVALIRAVAAANERTIVVVIAGGTVMLDPWDSEVPAVLLAWYPGMEGGRALADLLLGDAEPGGRLPVAIPRRREDLPVVDWNAGTVTYGRWWGQRKLDRDGKTAAYPFGFGLGYTTFDIQDVTAGPIQGERFPVTVTVTNTGARAGRHLVQIYATDPAHKGDAVRKLIGFLPVEAEPAERVRLTVDCTTRPLQRWTPNGFQTPHGSIFIEAAAHSGDPHAARTHLYAPMSS